MQKAINDIWVRDTKTFTLAEYERSLHVPGNFELVDIWNTYKNLTFVDLEYGNDIKDLTFISLAVNCRYLKHLKSAGMF